ncbi:hypothetical protein L915_20141, partial [Phytophthora nicotianae]
VSPSTEDCVGRCKAHFGVPKKRKLGCCIVCRALVCNSCRTTRKVTVDVAPDSVVQQTRCCICLLCMGYAKQTSATEFAAREMAMARARSKRALSTETSEYIL